MHTSIIHLLIVICAYLPNNVNNVYSVVGSTNLHGSVGPWDTIYDLELRQCVDPIDKKGLNFSLIYKVGKILLLLYIVESYQRNSKTLLAISYCMYHVSFII